MICKAWSEQQAFIDFHSVKQAGKWAGKQVNKLVFACINIIANVCKFFSSLQRKRGALDLWDIKHLAHSW